MTSTHNALNGFILTPQQQSLLFAALNSNKPGNANANSSLAMSPANPDGSPVQGQNQQNNLEESPYLDFDYDFTHADSSFDFSFDNSTSRAKMIGDLPGADSSAKSDTSDHDTPDKRTLADDEDDVEESGAKRRESEEKTSKKPGRKPLTSEPTTKRKAQNRAAQRAFRERKEKHLKDLETKVEELEKMSEDTSKENQQLRTKVDKLTVELIEYKKRIALLSGSRPTMPANKTFGHSVINNMNDVNFQFEFPKFGGALPGPTKTDAPKRSSSTPSVQSKGLPRTNSEQLSPREPQKDSNSPGNSSSYSVALDAQTKDDMAKFSASLFSPSLSGRNLNGSRTSFDSHFSAGMATTMSSPSASSHSNGGPSSSCGTSPEPYTQSPMGFKPVDQLTTIGEEQIGLTSSNQDLGQYGGIDFSNTGDLSWLPNANFSFDPQLFGSYREPQENVIAASTFDDNFFNDAFDMDFTTPYNMPTATAPAPKKDLLAQIDAAKETDEPVNGDGQMLTCNNIWEKLQTCTQVQSGDFDLDGLCSELQKKAKCSGYGAVVDEKDFKNVMKKYLNKSDIKSDAEGAACTGSVSPLA